MKSLKVVTAAATLHTESFGDPLHSPILLIMGAMASGHWWPEEFCSRLAAAGRFVIRYDHRDTGESTSYEPGSAPYAVEDLADDAVAILDAYRIDRAHIAGMSLGGYIAQLISLKYPGRVLSLTLIASERLAAADPDLPGIDPKVTAYHSAAAGLDWSDKKSVLEYQVGAWRLLTGPGRAFDRQAVEEIAATDYDRTSSPLSAFNHAQLAEPSRWLGRLHDIRVPILIIHGTHDPVLPYEHALALQRAFPDATLITLEGAGHELNRQDWPAIISAIARQTAS